MKVNSQNCLVKDSMQVSNIAENLRSPDGSL